ncbi:MAG TPA: O-antigen ligase family protein [Acidobacteriaceae bacterium]|nr:O-antigen ligase family protein [Acidobacteriaceae bacterium]
MPNAESLRAERFLRVHKYALVFLACSLAATLLLKIASIQYLELIFAADFLLLLWMFAKNDLRMRVFRPFASIGTSYLIFMAAALVLAVFALRQQFDTIAVPPLQRPLIVTVSRVVELFLDAFYMLYLANLFREDERLCAFGAKVYLWTGVASGLFSIAEFFLSTFAGFDPSGKRFHGFLNEGGPYGVYLLSLFALCFAMRRRGWLSRKKMYAALIVFTISLIGSQSKAAFFALALLGIVYLVWMLHGWKRVALLSTFGVLVVAASIVLDLPARMEQYSQAVAIYTQLSNLRAEDANVVKGRIAGAVLAPRMIKEHPLAGVGWGFYPLVRDQPEYRQGAAFEETFGDAPSLGPIDYIVDLGIPLWMYMMWILSKPVYFLRRYHADARVLALAAMQPIANLCGAHLNLTYTWIAAALAMGMGFGRRAIEETAA